jgi:formylmethanofuran dehydrogenase subunit B
LLCDDLAIRRNADGSLKVLAKGCAKSINFFERAITQTNPRFNGKNVTLDAAITEACDILRHARQPLIGGLSTDVQGMRAIMSLADQTGATLDHMNSAANIRNTLVVQNSGWQVTTLTEVRNRVDLLVIIGTDIVNTFPRFFERHVWNSESMFGQDTSERQVVYLGGRNLDTQAGISPKGVKPQVLACDHQHLPEVATALRALVGGKEIMAQEVAGISIADLKSLAVRLQNAKYSVIAWAAATLDFPHAELAIQNITGVIAKLNETTRSSGLPLAGNDADISANQVSTWITGYPVRNSYKRGYPEYDPYHFNASELLGQDETDALLWISTFNPDRLPPTTETPTIVIGHPDMKFSSEPDVFIPVGIPGVDHKATLFRSDNVVSLPLAKLRDTSLPSLAEVLIALATRLRGSAHVA